MCLPGRCNVGNKVVVNDGRIGKYFSAVIKNLNTDGNGFTSPPTLLTDLDSGTLSVKWEASYSSEDVDSEQVFLKPHLQPCAGSHMLGPVQSMSV